MTSLDFSTLCGSYSAACVGSHWFSYRLQSNCLVRERCMCNTKEYRWGGFILRLLSSASFTSRSTEACKAKLVNNLPGKISRQITISKKNLQVDLELCEDVFKATHILFPALGI